MGKDEASVEDGFKLGSLQVTTQNSLECQSQFVLFAEFKMLLSSQLILNFIFLKLPKFIPALLAVM